MTERIAEGAKIRRQSAVTVINALRSRRGDRSTLALLDGQRTGTPRHSEAATTPACPETKLGLPRNMRTTRALIVPLIIQACLAAMAQGQSPEMIGRWNVEITFADGNKRSLRFDAQEAGKGTLLVVDPRLNVWGPGKPSEAKWTREDQNSVTFTGPVEFMLGNVGRDAGTLMFKGKFETPDSISGEVEFAPLVGERPSKHGTFKAVRDNSAH
jgi:hypothetical protein